MTQPKDTTTTGEREAIADEVEARMRQRERTAGPVVTHRSSDSSETYDISERVTRRLRPEGWVQCEKEGPAKRLSDRIDRVEDERIQKIEDYNKETREMVETMKEEMSERKGAEKAQSRNLTIIVGVASAIGVAANLIGLLWKVRHGG